MRSTFWYVAVGLILGGGWARADGPTAAPRPIPLTRPDMKVLLEDMKQRTPRIPLPPLTDEEKAKLGDRGTGYEARLRALYLPTSDGRGSFGSSRDPDPAASLDYQFKTQLFWIVSRTNNCQYCLGHQESKLLATGMTDDEIASLDGDWAGHTPKQKAAYAFARNFTYEPHNLNDGDIAALRKHYTDLQILEMILSMAGNNSINRWKEGVGVPQSANGGGFRSKDGTRPPQDQPAEKQTYLTPTSDANKTKVTKVAPVALDEKGQPTKETVSKRPPLEPRAEVEAALAAARKRAPRLPLVDEAKAREVMGKDWPADAPVTPWVRLLANFTGHGKSRIVSQRVADEKGDLTPLLKAQVAWIVARQDRAWYATGVAKKRLLALDQTEDQVYALDGDWAKASPADRAMYTVAKHLAASPVVLTDEEVAAALKATSNRDVVQLVSYVTSLASFDRITEAAGLPLEK
jgi:AhpD family alkylhydroperoxidase